MWAVVVRRSLAFCTLLGFGTAALPARADGNEALGLTYHETATGLGLASAGVGLAGRRDGVQAPAPITSAELELKGIPASATIEQAFLYWVNFGAADPSVTFEGQAVSGDLIGTSADTCWNLQDGSFGYATAPNHTHRADVTEHVSGDGTYTLSGFPSFTATGDSQGASLVVAYIDESVSERGEVIIYDGAFTLKPSTYFSHSIVAPAPGMATLAELHLGVGDGQQVHLDGLMRFADTAMPAPNGVQHYFATSGAFWDNLVYDVTQVVELDGEPIVLTQDYGSDCLAIAYQGLVVQSAIVDEDDDGVHDPVDNCPDAANAEQLDSDSDGTGDACDNCPAKANPTQQDRDDDGSGDHCDICIDLANPDQADYDADARGDACDNCPCIVNPTQTDSDANGLGNACDPAAGGDDTPCDLSSGGNTAGAGNTPAEGGGGNTPAEGGDGNTPAEGGTKASGRGGEPPGMEAGASAQGEGGHGAANDTASSRDSGGCGCRMASGGSSPLALAGLTLLLGYVWRRRRRSAA